MIRFMIKYFISPVDLFQDQDPDQIMREGHLRKLQQQIRSLHYFIADAQGAPDDEGDVAGVIGVDLRYLFGQFGAAHLLAAQVQQNDIAVLLNLPENPLPLDLLDP